MTRSSRRAAVAGLYLGYLGLSVLWCLLDGRPAGIQWAILAVAVVISLLSCLAIWRASADLFLSDNNLLDERQRSVRDQAFRIAYLTISMIFAVVVAAYSWLTIPGAPTWGRCLLFPLGLTAFVFPFTLPLAAIAWTEPDPPEDSGTFTKTDK